MYITKQSARVVSMLNPLSVEDEQANAIEYPAMCKNLASFIAACYRMTPPQTLREQENYIKKRMRAKHNSVLEHISISTCIVCSRGISHELVRHRHTAFTQESTRYANYSMDRHGNSCTFILPQWLLLKPFAQYILQECILPLTPDSSDFVLETTPKELLKEQQDDTHFLVYLGERTISGGMFPAETWYTDALYLGDLIRQLDVREVIKWFFKKTGMDELENPDGMDELIDIFTTDKRQVGQWFQDMSDCETKYMVQLANGLAPENARGVLPNDLKTVIYTSASIREWLAIFDLRSLAKAGRPHPDMRALATDLIHDMYIKYPAFFEEPHSYMAGVIRGDIFGNLLFADEAHTEAN